MSAPALPVSGPVAFDLDALERLLRRRLSAEQAAVVTAPLEAGVVVAGAGSGKTSTMVARVVWLVARGLVAPDGVLGLTFTTKAADELASRVRGALRDLRCAGRLPDEHADLEPVVSTYHAYAARLVRDHALRAGREPGSRLITPATAWQLAARAVQTYDGPLDAREMAEQTAVQAVLGLAGDLAEHLVEPDEVRRFGADLQARADAARTLQKPAREALTCQRAREQLLPLVERYTASKRARDLMDFGDVVALAAQLARDCPQVAEAERQAHPVVLLDEYQDTGAAQELLLSSLFGGGHAVTAVGDPCQSIYGWRGASAGTLRRFAVRFAAARPARPTAVPAARLTATPATRPTPPPPAALSGAFRGELRAADTPAGAGGARTLSTNYRGGGRVLRLANRLAAPLRTEGLAVPELAPAPGEEASGEVRCGLLGDVVEEAAWIAAQVRDALGERPADPELPHWSRAAVLCRKRSMFPRLRAAFDDLGVPVEVVGLGGLLDVPEVADLVATLRVLDDPTADAALLRLLTGPRWRLGPRDLAALGRRARALAAHEVSRAADPVEAVVLGADDERTGSLVDALDDLPPHGLSDEGRRRLEQLRDELRGLRRRADQPLPDLVADVERTLGLDVEVLARPGTAGPAEARAALDAFADAAAGFAGDAAQDGSGEAVLSAFLAYLAAAEDEENGLDLGAPGASDTVKLMTVHAAKGLEWPVVAVPGLARSEKPGGAAVFPGRPRGTSWLRNPRLLPFDLRGDAEDLPELTGLEPPDLARFAEALRTRDEHEERRLAYVAVTRAEQVLLCSGYHWGDGTLPLGPSEFLSEVRAACEDGAGHVDVWCEQAADVNPVVCSGTRTPWPAATPPAGEGAQRAAARVRELLADPSSRLEPSGEPEAGLSAAAARQVASWDDDLARLEEEAERRRRAHASVVLPASLSVSGLVELRRDPRELARSLLRPVPRRPSPVTRRGTAFHAWLESTVFGTPQLLDPLELPGSADEPVTDADLRALQEAFQRSAWWGRQPYEIEVPFEMELEGLLVRGRMDAVYLSGEDGSVEVVDWKTGRRPSGEQAQAAAVQLAAYRLAWSRLSGTPLARVSAAFHYVLPGQTVRPADLLDEQGLRELVRAVPVAPVS